MIYKLALTACESDSALLEREEQNERDANALTFLDSQLPYNHRFLRRGLVSKSAFLPKDCSINLKNLGRGPCRLSKLSMIRSRYKRRPIHNAGHSFYPGNPAHPLFSPRHLATSGQLSSRTENGCRLHGSWRSTINPLKNGSDTSESWCWSSRVLEWSGVM
jgi:hypothetical protein